MPYTYSTVHVRVIIKECTSLLLSQGITDQFYPSSWLQWCLWGRLHWCSLLSASWFQTRSAHFSIIMSRTKVTPIKWLSIPRLELCGAVVLAKLLQHVQRIFNIPQSDIFAWTDSTIVLNWLTGNPRCFKTYVGNRISSIIDHISPDRWRHVAGADNPADCASRGVFPLDLLDHRLWWHGCVKIVLNGRSNWIPHRRERYLPCEHHFISWSDRYQEILQFQST